MPWRVAIADDEPLARLGVRQLLARHRSFEVVLECRDGHEARRALDSSGVDLMFLDIAMPGMDGVEVARHRADPRGAVIVFLTAHSSRAVEAFEANAIDYMVKPISVERFARTIERVTERLQARRTGSDSPSLLAHTRNGMIVLAASEVEWIEGANHYARVTCRGRRYLIRETLNTLETRLAGAGFLRVHRSALVRVAQVQRFARSNRGEAVVVLHSGAKVAVSRRREAQVTAVLQGKASSTTSPYSRRPARPTDR